MVNAHACLFSDVTRTVQVTVEVVLAAKVDPDSLSQVIDATSMSAAVAEEKVTTAPATLVAARVWE